MSEGTGGEGGLRPLDWRKVLYDAALVVLAPLIALYPLGVLLSRRRPAAHVAQMLGAVPEPVRRLKESGDPIVWVQAVSAGEVAALGPFLQHLRQLEPQVRVVLSTTTGTGYAMAEKLDLEVDALIVFPLDFPGICERVLDAIGPELIVLVETELWPNLLAAAYQRRIPVCVVNGRISEMSYPRYRLFGPLARWGAKHLESVCTQNDKYRERFVALGVPRERVETVGNYKFDEAFPLVPAEEAAKWRQDLGFSQEQPILLAASTHAPEEEHILQSFEQLRREVPDLGLLIAPRHPRRAESVEGLIRGFGYRCVRRSQGLACAEAGAGGAEGQVRIALLDTMGELNRVFAIGTVVYMGGSLAPVGGHNILQPIAQGKPVVFGPHMQNQRDLVEVALAEGAAVQVRNAAELTEALRRLLASEGERELMVARGGQLIQKHTGAARTCALRAVALLHAG